VNPTRSQNRTETVLRSSSVVSSGASVSGAVQKPQKENPAGFSFPQTGQITTPSLGPTAGGGVSRSYHAAMHWIATALGWAFSIGLFLFVWIGRVVWAARWPPRAGSLGDAPSVEQDSSGGF
jgi:hypothetical protein